MGKQTPPEEIHRRIRITRESDSIHDAAERIGIAFSTLTRWLNRYHPELKEEIKDEFRGHRGVARPALRRCLRAALEDALRDLDKGSMGGARKNIHHALALLDERSLEDPEDLDERRESG